MALTFVNPWMLIITNKNTRRRYVKTPYSLVTKFPPDCSSNDRKQVHDWSLLLLIHWDNIEWANITKKYFIICTNGAFIKWSNINMILLVLGRPQVANMSRSFPFPLWWLLLSVQFDILQSLQWGSDLSQLRCEFALLKFWLNPSSFSRLTFSIALHPCCSIDGISE